MEKLVIKITDYLIHTELLEKDKRKWCEYVLYKRFSFISVTIVLFIISYLLGYIYNTIIFFIGFVLLRRRTGGYHANTPIQCVLISSISVLILPVVVNILYNINIEYRMVLGFIAVGIIIYLSPINHPNMRLTPKESIANKKMATKNVIICILIIIIDELFFSKSIYIMSLYYSIFLTTVLMILAKIIKQEVNNYET